MTFACKPVTNAAEENEQSNRKEMRKHIKRYTTQQFSLFIDDAQCASACCLLLAAYGTFHCDCYFYFSFINPSAFSQTSYANVT